MQIIFATVVILAAVGIGGGTRQSLEDVLIGAWSGTLEYRDYRSDRRVTLPTQLVVTKNADGTLHYAYTYDDGPGKIVKSVEQVTIAADRSTYRIQNGDGSYDATFKATGLADASQPVVLLGAGTENDAPVDIRITITATDRSFTMLRESRRAGDDWAFRNRYTLSR